MKPIISLDQVSKSFSGRRVLSDVSLDVEKGSTVGIVGANGSGKSVLFNIICGFLTPDSGQVYVRSGSGKGPRFSGKRGSADKLPRFHRSQYRIAEFAVSGGDPRRGR